MPDLFETFRDPLFSLYQSAVTEIAKKIDANQASGGHGMHRMALQRSSVSTLPDVAASIVRREYYQAIGKPHLPTSTALDRDLTARGIAQVCAELAFRYLKAVASGDEKAVAQVKDEYTGGTCDAAWITTLEEYRRYFGPDGKRKPIPYIRSATVGPKTIEIKANARIAMIGDWGTGAHPAIEVLKLISDDKPDVLVHLGDIYYSGTPSECEAHFNDPINLILRKGSMLPVFTLSGNHDMYCGGVGFYDLITKLNPPSFTQPASFFCLRSADEKWQLLAMDTGLHDDNPATVANALVYLEDDELAWHCDRIQEFGGRTILLSHHQLFSAFSAIGPANPVGRRSATNPLLLKSFQKMAGSKKIAAWFWGHEHTLSIYKPFAGLERGRCLGNGAVPVSIIEDTYEPLPDLEEAPSIVDGTKLGTRGGVYNHGYVMLSLHNELCEAEYFEATAKGRNIIYKEYF